MIIPDAVRDGDRSGRLALPAGRGSKEEAGLHPVGPTARRPIDDGLRGRVGGGGCPERRVPGRRSHLHRSESDTSSLSSGSRPPHGGPAAHHRRLLSQKVFRATDRRSGGIGADDLDNDLDLCCFGGQAKFESSRFSHSPTRADAKGGRKGALPQRTSAAAAAGEPVRRTETAEANDLERSQKRRTSKRIYVLRQINSTTNVKVSWRNKLQRRLQ